MLRTFKGYSDCEHFRNGGLLDVCWNYDLGSRGLVLWTDFIGIGVVIFSSSEFNGRGLLYEDRTRIVQSLETLEVH